MHDVLPTEREALYFAKKIEAWWLDKGFIGVKTWAAKVEPPPNAKIVTAHYVVKSNLGLYLPDQKPQKRKRARK